MATLGWNVGGAGGLHVPVVDPGAGGSSYSVRILSVPGMRVIVQPSTAGRVCGVLLSWSISPAVTAVDALIDEVEVIDPAGPHAARQTVTASNGRMRTAAALTASTGCTFNAAPWCLSL